MFTRLEKGDKCYIEIDGVKLEFEAADDQGCLKYIGDLCVSEFAALVAKEYYG